MGVLEYLALALRARVTRLRVHHVREAIHVNAPGNGQRQQRHDRTPEDGTHAQGSGTKDPQPLKRADKHSHQWKRGQHVAHVPLAPLHLRHGNSREARECHPDGSQEAHTTSPLTVQGTPATTSTTVSSSCASPQHSAPIARTHASVVSSVGLPS